MLTRTEDLAEVEEQVMDIAHRNWTVTNLDNASNWLSSNESDMQVEIEFGTALVTSDGLQFQTGAQPINSVRVHTSKQLPIFGFASDKIKELNIVRDATAIALERDICLVIDRSGSMTFDLNTGTWMNDYSYHSYNKMAMSSSWYYRRYRYQWWWYWPHPTKSRWSTMIPAMYGLADELDKTKQNEMLSIASYSTSYSINFYDHSLRTRNYRQNAASRETGMTSNYRSAVKQVEDKYMYDQLVAGGTSISSGIDMGTQILTGSDTRPNAFKTMIVMTDGQHNSGRPPWEAAADAAAAGIEVYTVTFSNQADQLSMQTTAEDGNGKHFHAPNGDALEEVFREIANIPPAAYLD